MKPGQGRKLWAGERVPKHVCEARVSNRGVNWADKVAMLNELKW